MKFEIGQPSLTNALSKLSKAVNMSSVLDVLKCVRFVQEDTTIFLETTDLEVHIRYKGMQSYQLTDRQFCVPFSQLNNLAKKAKAHDVFDCEFDGAKLYLNTPKFKYTLDEGDIEDFPKWHHIDWSKDTIKVSYPQFKKALDWAFFASKSDDTNGMQGVNLQCTREGLDVQGTDGFRISYTKIPFDNPMELGYKVVLPRNTIQLLSSLNEPYESVYIQYSLTQNRVYFKVGNWEISTRMLDCNYPDVANVITTISGMLDVEFLVDKYHLCEVCEGMQGFSTQPIADAVFIFDKDKLKVEYKHKDDGKAESEVLLKVVDKAEYPKFSLLFNVQFYIDALRRLETDFVRVLCKADNENPRGVFLKPYNGMLDTTAIIMPMKVKD